MGTAQRQTYFIKKTENALLPFLTTYLCKAELSALAVIKSQYRNCFDPHCDIQCTFLINIYPHIEELMESIQHQGTYKKYYSVLHFSSKFICIIL